MKKTLLKMTALTALLSASNFAFADAADELQNRLNQVTVLSADFSQTVTSVGGKNVQQGSGKLQIKRPNLFRMNTKSPQETQIIADGKTLCLPAFVRVTPRPSFSKSVTPSSFSSDAIDRLRDGCDIYNSSAA